MPAAWLGESIVHVGQALREPEAFALRWQRGEVAYRWWVWQALIATAILGTTTYGMTMGILGGVDRILWAGLSCTLAAGLSWGISLPALYVFNSISGSRLSASATFLAALVTTSWGGLAMIASIPINWFFTVAAPYAPFILAVNLVVFAGVGLAMVDVFARVIERLEPARGRWPALWLGLVAAMGGELFYVFGLFEFTLKS